MYTPIYQIIPTRLIAQVYELNWYKTKLIKLIKKRKLHTYIHAGIYTGKSKIYPSLEASIKIHNLYGSFLLHGAAFSF